jgi:hypothetical protein
MIYQLLRLQNAEYAADCMSVVNSKDAYGSGNDLFKACNTTIRL